MSFATSRKTPAPIELGPLLFCFDAPVLMGVINATPDSFSDGGVRLGVAEAVARARQMVADGASIVDIGGESTRPSAEPVAARVELMRVLPVVEAVVEAGLGVAVSVDTRKAEVARAALAAGAHMINDVSALGDPAMGEVVAEHGAALVLMHMRGDPRTMQRGDIVYDDLFGELCGFFDLAIDRATRAGVARERLMIDPGIGFGKTTGHNLQLTRHLEVFARYHLPVLYGPSRKRFLGEVTGREVHDRDRATAAACALAVLLGAHVLRVHDVGAARDAVLVARAVRDAGGDRNR